MAALVIAAGLAASCSSSTAPEPEPTEQQDSRLTSCGTPLTLQTTADAASHLTQAVNPTAGLFVPSTVQATGAMWYANTLISAHVKLGAVTCDYASYVPQATPVDLAFQQCTGGVTPGTSIAVSSVELWGTMNGNVGAAGLIATLGRSLDSGNACIINTCQNGTIIPSNAPNGTGCDDGNVCNGLETCTNGVCDPTSGAAPPVDDGDPCTTDTACIAPSTPPTHTPIPGCGVPHGGAPAYPGSPSLPSDFAGGAAFLYGPNGNQPLLMDAKRIAIVRGRVIDGSTVPPPVPAVPVAGATVKVLNHPEFGTSTTGADGYYDLAVNGGDTFTVEIAMANHPTVQRKVATRWLDFSVLPDVVMVPLDPPNTVNLDGNKATIGWQTARGAPKTDADGTRQATLLIPPGTTVSNWTPSGSTLTFRATEFTVGANGPAAMPADLPPTSAYTYALDFSIDEATQPSTTFTNADSTYANSVIFYVEHFMGPGLSTLGQPAVNVPSGYYDRAASIWKTESSGRIVRILYIANSAAVLSLDGTTPMSTQDMANLGITTGELQQLATAPLYAGATNKDLWRVRIPHFTSYDCNWNAGLENTARPPPEAAPRSDTPEKDSCTTAGSIIECENQVLGESLPIAGTPFSLNYRSERQNGYHPTITVPISDETAASIPGSFDHGEVEIVVAGKRALLTFGRPAVNQRLEWSWDRTDAYGRVVQGTTTAHVKVSYAYRGVTSNYTSDFGKFGTGFSFGLSRGARTISLEKSYDVTVGGLDAKPLGLGGWTLSANHVLEPAAATTWLGTGGKMSLRDQGDLITTRYLDSNSYANNDVAVAGDGTVYVSHQFQNSAGVFVARLVGAGATAISLPGLVNYASFTDGAPLSGIYVDPRAIVVGADDFLYVAETYRVLRVNRTTLQTYLVAGSRQSARFGPTGTSPDGTVAAGAPLNTLSSVALGADGLVYFAEAVPGGLVRRVRTNGTLETVAGTGAYTGVSAGCETSDLCRADQQAFHAITAIAIDPKGGLYLYPQGEYRVWRMDGDNTIHLVAGNGSLAPSYAYPNGDGGSARDAPLGQITGLSFSRGSLYLAGGDLRIRRVGPDGSITRAAGNGTTTLADGSVATASGMLAASRVVQGPDGYFLVADGARIRRFGMGAPIVVNNTLVMSPGGDEVYKFDTTTGQHLFTSTPYRGTTHYTFHYADPQSRLTAIDDAFSGRTTQLTYGTGSVTITGPYGQATTLGLDSNGYLATITNPNTAEVVHVTHSATGLLQTLTDALGKVHTFSYTSTGLLARDKNAFPNTSGVSLSRNATDRSFSVLVTSPEGRGTLHTVDMTRASTDPLRVERRTHVGPSGVQVIEDRRSDSSRTVTYPNLSGQTNTIADTLSPDPRFSFGSAYLAKRVTYAGASKTNTETTARAVVPSQLTDPFALTSQTDTTTFSGGSANALGAVTEAFTSGSPATLTTTTPSLQVVRTLDASDRVQRITLPGTVPCISPCPGPALVPVDLGYTDGRLTSAIQTGLTATRATTIALNPSSGFVTSVATPMGTVGYSNHDAMGRPQTVTLPGNRAVTLAYDLNGNATTVTTPRAYSHGFTPNALDLLGTYTPPSSSPGGATSYTYGADSLLMSVQEPQATSTISRDFAGRVTNVTYPTSTGTTESVSTTYDPTTGNVATRNSNLGPGLSYSYDGDMVTTETSTGSFGHTLNKTFDNYQRLTDRKIDNVAATNVHFAYDPDGRLATITGPSTNSTYTLTRAASNGLLASTTFSGGGHTIADAYQYDEFGGITRYKVTFDTTTTIYDVTYTRDPASGRITGKTETIGPQSAPFSSCTAGYVYDPSTHFLEQQTGCPWAASWDYDANGNNTTYGTSFDAQDRMNVGSLGYDADGDTVSQSNGWSFLYDVPGNLRRVAAPWPSPTVLWDGERIVGMEKVPWGVVGHYVYATRGNVPDLMYAPQGGASWSPFRIISDPLGSVKLVVRLDAAYSPTAGGSTFFEWHDYSPWGIPVAGGGAQFGYVPFGFAGGLYDTNTGLYRYGARDYNPWVGRWWSKDPSRFGGGLNLYAYAGNDPVNLLDPEGRTPKGAAMGGFFGGFVGGVVGGVVGAIAGDLISDAVEEQKRRDALDKLPDGGVCPSEPVQALHCVDPCDTSEGQGACYTCCDFYGKDARQCRSSCCGIYR